MILRGAVGYVLVLLGGLVLAVVPVSSPVVGWPVVGDLRAGSAGRMLALVVVVVGLGLAAAAWLRLVRYVGAATDPDDEGRMRLVRRAALWWCVPLLLAPAMFSRDGWSYAAQGEMTRLGISPYVWSPSVLTGPIVEAVDSRWMGTLTPYGPLPLLWGAFAAYLTQNPWLLVVAYRVLALAGLALLAYAVPRLAAWAGRDPALAAALVLPSPLMLAHGIAGAHNDVIMAGLMAASLVVAVERSWVAGAFLAGLAAAVKVPAGLVGIGVALMSLPLLPSAGQRVRRLLAVGLLAVVALVLAGGVGGLGVGWVHALGVPGEVRTPFSATTQLGQLTGFVLDRVGADVSVDEAVTVARLLGSVTVLLVAAHVALRHRTGVPGAAVRSVALVMLAVLVLSPVVHPWYLLWCLPLLAVCHLPARGSWALLHVSWLVGLVAPLDSSLAGAVAAIVVGVVLVCAVALRQAVSLRRATYSERATPGRRWDARSPRRTLVVVPTYNEADNVVALLDRVRVAKPDADVLVVDDSSPDGTAQLVRSHRDFHAAPGADPDSGPGAVHLLSRTAKDGLGAAYRAGFGWALERGYDAVVQMDADLSHPAERVPALVAALEEADVAVGSRYVPGGRVANWPVHRRFISWAGNVYVRALLDLPVHDTTAGFKAFRREALQRIGALDSASNGYCFQVENTWRAARLGLRVVEVPITFTDRTLGTSKMSGAIVLEAMARVVTWRSRELLGPATSSPVRLVEEPVHVVGHMDGNGARLSGGRVVRVRVDANDGA